MPNILVVGSANMDITAPVDRLPTPGESLLIDPVLFDPGGKGANSATAAARLGSNVTFVGAVGDDPAGLAVRQNFIRENIDTTHLQTISTPTGTALIFLDKRTAQNAILIAPAANFAITLPDDPTPFQQADAMMLQLETRIELNIAAATRAAQHDVLTILDPAPAVTKLPNKLYQHCHVISPNQTELSTLTGRPAESPEQAAAAARKLLDHGAQHVVVKLAEHGSLWISPHTTQHFPPAKIEPVDTVAAGDAFTGCLTHFLAQTRDFPHAIKQANLAGALACTKPGALTAMPTAAELAAFTKAQ